MGNDSNQKDTEKFDVESLGMAFQGLLRQPAEEFDIASYSMEDFPIKPSTANYSSMGGGLPGYITIGPERKAKKMTRFWKNGELKDEYPLGQLLTDFLNLDFTDYDEKRLELLEKLSDEEFVKGLGIYFTKVQRPLVREFARADETVESMRTKIAYDFTYFGFVGYEGLNMFYFPNHRYFYRREPIDDYLGHRDTFETLLKSRANYHRMQDEIRKVIRFCLYLDEPGRQSGLEARNLYDLGQVNRLFSVSTDLKYLMAGYFTEGRLEPFAPLLEIASRDDAPKNPNASLLLLSEPDRKDLYSRYADDRKKGSSILGFSDGHPGSLAMVELMALIENNARVRECGICHRPFVLRTKRDAKYCPGFPLNGEKSCRKLGSQRDADLRNGTPLKRAYLKRYKYRYEKVLDLSASLEGFHEWQKRAQRRIRKAEKDPSKEPETLLWLKDS